VNTRAVKLMMGQMETYNALRSATSQTPHGHAPDKRVAAFGLSYLSAFGYLEKELDKWKDITLDDILYALGLFQARFGLQKSRNLDVQTVRAMEAPRCGCPDVIRDRHQCAKALKASAKRNLPRWKKTGLTYSIVTWLPGISKPDFELAVELAFKAWTVHGNIDVRPDAKDPDIVITGGRGAMSNFDGAGGTLAWAFLPAGNDAKLTLKLDLDEVWSLTPDHRRGFLLPNVLRHEVGHLFGLGHSRKPGALMAPYYNAAVREPISHDDIAEFQARYT